MLIHLALSLLYVVFLKKMIRNLLTYLIFMAFAINSYATHIVGGELSYEALGNNQYRITLKVYRDCINGVAPFDNPASVGIFNSSGSLVTEVLISSPTITNLPIVVTNPCLQVPPVICTEEAIYQKVVTLNIPSGGLDLIYQRCCRNSIIQNIVNPEDMGSTYISHIPDPSLAVDNNGAHFLNVPPLVLCNGDDFVFDHSAVDADGDVLVYEMCTPYHGANRFAPMPQPPFGGPYTNITWSAGYGINNQINGTQNLQINSNTGELICTPTSNGVYVVGICVKEYRNGQLINTTLRDFQFTVVSCSSNIISAVPNQTILCDGYTMEFENNSINGAFYHWDFGVSSILNDTSNLVEPVYTYPDTGMYDVTLIANPGWPCADTSIATYMVQYPIQGSIDNVTNQCLDNNSFDFAINGNFTPTADFSWHFGGTTTPNSSTSQTPQNISYVSDGVYTVTTSVNDRGCFRDFTQQLEVYAMPEAILSPIDNCFGLTANAINNSINATSYFWDFGDLTSNADTSLQTSPSYTYPSNGMYDVMLIASNGNCADTAYTTHKVKEPINPVFSTNLSPQCITSNSFDFLLNGNYSSGAAFSWDFGGVTSPLTSISEHPTNVNYNSEGYYLVTATVEDEGCEAVYTDSVVVFPSPIINFRFDTIGCMPFTVDFIDESIAWGDVDYFWDFGNGVTTTEQEPTYTYEIDGVYDVTFSLTTNEGCIETLTLNKPEAIIVYPRPKADFSVSPEATTIYFPEVEITDLSSGDISNMFYTVEGNVLEEFNPTYSLEGMGDIPIMQTVVNVSGCEDTVTKFVYVEPDDLLYIPNSFTPNGDGNNDYFKPVSFGLEEYQFYIYNRWGSIIYEGDQSSIGWDGKRNGKLVQDDAYVWQIRYRDYNRRLYEKKGHVLIVK